MEKNPEIRVEAGTYDVDNSKFDDDGHVKRTGTVGTATAHIITTVIGSGVLSLPWVISQLGWIAGPIALVAFSVITWFSSILLADCYRWPNPVTGTRNPVYMDAVRASLGQRKAQLLGLAQYATQAGGAIGFTVTASISMVAVKRSNCFHRLQIREGCHARNNNFILLFSLIEVVLSQIQNLHKLTFLSVIASVMSITYSTIGLGLSIAHVAGGAHPITSITGRPVTDKFTGSDKIYTTFSAIGNAAFAYAFSLVFIEIQDTLKSSPPENQEMKKASSIAVAVTSFFYILCGVMGYAAFGNNSPGNILTGFGFFEPFWLIDIANICIMIHLVGSYQVLSQPIFGFVEGLIRKKWTTSKFVTKEYLLDLPFVGMYNFSVMRLVWRTIYVLLTMLIAMAFPNFNDVMGLVGAISFWPLTIYFPVEMYIAQAKIKRFSFTWIWMKVLSIACLGISILAAVGSVYGLIANIHSLKPFNSVS